MSKIHVALYRNRSYSYSYSLLFLVGRASTFISVVLRLSPVTRHGHILRCVVRYNCCFHQQQLSYTNALHKTTTYRPIRIVPYSLTERVSDRARMGRLLVGDAGGRQQGRQADGSDGCSQQCTTVLFVVREGAEQPARITLTTSVPRLNYTTDTRLDSCRRWMEIGEEGDL